MAFHLHLLPLLWLWIWTLQSRFGDDLFSIHAENFRFCEKEAQSDKICTSKRERTKTVWVQRHIDMYFHLLVCVFTKYKHVGCQLLFALNTEKMCAYFRHRFEYSLQRFSPKLWHLCIPLKALSFQNIFSLGRTGWRTKDKVAGQLLKSLQYEISGAQSYQPVRMI